MDIRLTPARLSGEIRAISSKSDVHRLLLAAALAGGRTEISFTTLSEDVQATVSVLRAMGAEIGITGADGGYTAAVRGMTDVPRGITLDANECGTTARLILPIAAALCDAFTLTGRNGLQKRPFAELCACMAENGTVCSDTLLPITARGRLQSGIFKLRGDVSSQYISGLLFALPLLAGDSEILLTTPLVSAGYVDMTLRTLARFGIAVTRRPDGFFIQGGQRYISDGAYVAEGDWSNASFWLCGNAIGGDITVNGLDADSLQKDKAVADILRKSSGGAIEIDGEDIPDALPILATVLALAKGRSVITGGARLRLKESDRIATTVAMLRALGADITGTADGFILNGVPGFTGGVVDAANDHRIAMCAAIASQRASGDVIIRGAECIAKSYPTFFNDFTKLGGNCRVIDGQSDQN